MITKNEVHAFQQLPATVKNLSEQLHLSPSSASKTVEKLIENGLATKQRTGKTVLIQQAHTNVAHKLEELMTVFPRLPFEHILTYTTLSFLASFHYQLTIEERAQTLGVSRQWIHKTIKLLSSYGIILKQGRRYAINPLHQKISEFASTYVEFQHYQQVKQLTDDAVILWHHGNEFLFTTKRTLPREQKTAISVFTDYDLPLISDKNYYYATPRQLAVSDVLLHTILIDPTSKTYNTYALLLYERATPPDVVKKARLYNLVDHTQHLLGFLKTHHSRHRFLPLWDDYETLAIQYGVRA